MLPYRLVTGVSVAALLITAVVVNVGNRDSAYVGDQLGILRGHSRNSDSRTYSSLGLDIQKAIGFAKRHQQLGKQSKRGTHRKARKQRRCESNQSGSRKNKYQGGSSISDWCKPAEGVNMPWSIFTQGGGQGAAETWAYDLLKKLGVPQSAGNAQFIYDWEVSEGGGGKYNPLNQGPVPGHPSLTTTGSQYGGGAADFASISAGLQGASDYLHMPAYRGILSNLKSNNPAGARAALIASPWAASHYGNGSAFSNSPLPGKKNKIKGTVGSGGGGGATTTSAMDCGSPLTAILGGVNGIEQYVACKSANSITGSNGGPGGASGFTDLMERAGLILLGALMIIIGIIVLTRAPSMAMGALGVTARTSRQIRAINPPSRGPTEAQTADRAARLELAQRNAAIGEQKAAIAASKEKRLGGQF